MPLTLSTAWCEAQRPRLLWHALLCAADASLVLQWAYGRLSCPCGTLFPLRLAACSYCCPCRADNFIKILPPWPLLSSQVVLRLPGNADLEDIEEEDGGAGAAAGGSPGAQQRQQPKQHGGESPELGGSGGLEEEEGGGGSPVVQQQQDLIRDVFGDDDDDL